MPYAVQKQRTKSTTIPAPVGGVNALNSLYGMEPTDAVYQYNIIPKEFGLTVRKGTREHVINLDNPVLTVMTYRDITTGAETLFAATIDGIFDVTVRTDAPSAPVLPWPNNTGEAGYCSFTQWVDVSNTGYLLVADAVNGYYIYDGTTWTLAIMTGAGPDAIDIDFVMVWKSRVWFLAKNSATGWFLAPGQIEGSLLDGNLEFGNKFRYGDGVVGLYNWTLEDGSGLDNLLVVLGRAGDVLVYKATDPTTVDLNLVGHWYVGPFPAGNRLTTDYGGDLMILSTYGIISLQGLMAGVALERQQQWVSAKISPYVREVMRDTINFLGWEVRVDPDEGVMIVMSPQRGSKARIQFVMYTATQSWCMYRGLKMDCGVYSRDNFYYGEDNSVIEMTGTLDNVSFDNQIREPIPWALLTSYQDYGSPGHWKRAQFLRPLFISQYAPDYTVSARYDFNIEDIGQQPISLPRDGSLWDEALWDSGIWGGGFSVVQQPSGASGMGRHVAIQVIGRSSFRTTFVGVDVMLDAGGML